MNKLFNAGSINNIVSGTKNKIINGDMIIDQRYVGVSKTFTAAAAVSYCVDRFYGSCTGANVTGQQITGTGLYSKAYQFTGLAANTGVLFGQRIEALNCRDLLNKDVAVQAELSSTSLTTITWNAYYATVADTFSTKTLIATGSITIGTTPTVYNFTFNAGANARNGICIEFVGGALLASQTLTFSGIQLELGKVATSFEYLQYGVAIGVCQRYYEKNFPINAIPSITAVANLNPILSQSSSAWDANSINPVYFKISKRAIPTIVAFSSAAAGTTYVDYYTTGWYSGYGGGISITSEVGFSIYGSYGGSAAATTLRQIRMGWTADAEL